MKRLLKNFVLLTVPAFVVALLLLEVVFRTVIPATNPPPACFDLDERVFKFCPDAGTGVATFGKFAQQRGRWRINHHGWNSAIEYEETKTRPRIAIIGDSYVEALQVDVTESFPALLRAALGPRYDVYSFGISGAALSEYLHLARYVERHFHPDVLIFSVVHNDFVESVEALNPADRIMMMLRFEGDRVVETTPEPDLTYAQFNRKKRLLRKSALARYLVLNLRLKQTLDNLLHPRAYQANVDVASIQQHAEVAEKVVEYVLGRIAAENPDKRVIFVMGAPKHAIYAGTLAASPVIFLNDLLGRACARYGFEFIDLAPAMTADWAAHHRRFNSEYDGHWNEYGHALVCRKILELGFP